MNGLTSTHFLNDEASVSGSCSLPDFRLKLGGEDVMAESGQGWSRDGEQRRDWVLAEVCRWVERARGGEGPGSWNC